MSESDTQSSSGDVGGIAEQRPQPRKFSLPARATESSDAILLVEDEDLPVYHMTPRNADGSHRDAAYEGSKSRSSFPGGSRRDAPSVGSAGDEFLFLPGYLVALVVVGTLMGATGTALGIYNVAHEPSGGTSTAGMGADGNLAIKSTLETIYERGNLNCGTGPDGAPGFLLSTGQTDVHGFAEYVGLEVDLCLALTSAIFGAIKDEEGQPHYRILPTAPTERWHALGVNQTVDVLFRSTHTLERDVYEATTQQGFEFSTPYFWDGLVLGGWPDYLACAEQLDFVSATEGGVNCTQTLVCVEQGTTHETILKDQIPPANLRSKANNDRRAWLEECTVIAGERGFVNSQAVQHVGYLGPYALGTQLLSQEPIALATRQGDARWTDFVEWTLQALIYAEEQGITAGSAAVRMDKTNVFNLNNASTTFEDMFKHAVAGRGNYGEIYNFNLQSFLPRGINSLNGGDAPIITAFPFGNLNAAAVPPPALELRSPTVAAIKQRGFLNCGIDARLGFANFDAPTQTRTGFDVDLCRALAAALFDGDARRLLFTELPASRRFPVLTQGRVDVLARLTTRTLSRDVQEPQTGQGLSFAAPYIYDGLTFGGIPPWDVCADNLDVISPVCQSLQVCLLQGTTIFRKVQALLRDKYVIPKLTFREVIDGLNDGSCNAIAGGFHDVHHVAVQSIREGGYTGNYSVGSRRHSKDPLALTTRQDDPAWSDFVRWIFWALVHAEEQGITQDTASLMPRTTAFGPLRSSALFHAVNAVGNYGQVYERNFGTLIPRTGLHLLHNTTLGGPMLYAMPGIPTRDFPQ